MKDYKPKKDILKKGIKEESPEEQDNINIRFALTIEELCSDDFLFEDETDTTTSSE